MNRDHLTSIEVLSFGNEPLFANEQQPLQTKPETGKENHGQEFLVQLRKSIDGLMQDEAHADLKKTSEVYRKVLSYLSACFVHNREEEVMEYFSLKNALEIWIYKNFGKRIFQKEAGSQNEIAQRKILSDGLCYASDPRIAQEAKTNTKEELKEFLPKLAIAVRSKESNAKEAFLYSEVGNKLEALAFKAVAKELREIVQILNEGVDKCGDEKVKVRHMLAFLVGPHLATSPFKGAQRLGKGIICSFAEAHGLPREKVWKAWMSNLDSARHGGKAFLRDLNLSAELRSALTQNMHILSKLSRSGEKGENVALSLYRRFGLLNFGRFSPEFLLEQYKKQDDTEIPYVLVVFATDDNNVSSFNEINQQAYQNLFLQSKGKFLIRAVEGVDKPGMGKILSFCKKHYPLRPPVIILSGHASEREFVLGPARFGSRHYKNLFGRRDLSEKNLERIRPYLGIVEKGSFIILDGCHKDVPKSFMRMLAEKTGCKVVFPDGQSSVEEFTASDLDHFTVKYAHGAKQVVYDPETNHLK